MSSEHSKVTKLPEDDGGTKLLEDGNLFLLEVKRCVGWIERGVKERDSRFIARALRLFASLRHKLTLFAHLLPELVNSYVASPRLAAFTREALVGLDLSKTSEGVDVPMVQESSHLEEKPEDNMAMDSESSWTHIYSREVEVFVGLLCLNYLMIRKELHRGLALSESWARALHDENRRSLDLLAARVYSFFARFCELTGKVAKIRGILLDILRTSTVRRDLETQATLINLLLRNYQQGNLYDQMSQLIARSIFPEEASNNQHARYHYYRALCSAIQLDYTLAHKQLSQALLKAPHDLLAVGFRQSVQKLRVIVELLMGEIPEREIFHQAIFKKSLLPYMHLTQGVSPYPSNLLAECRLTFLAVRIGDLSKFQDTMCAHIQQFQKDKTYTLILRLRHNVIRTGLKMISISYSRISFEDICVKLHLDSKKDAEYIVAKAIRDSVIDAVIDHQKGIMCSNEAITDYISPQALRGISNRIFYCLKLQESSVKALRFPASEPKKKMAILRDLREKQQEIESAIVDSEDDANLF